MRDEHTFQFSASAIAKSARSEVEYHRQRQAYWEEEYKKAVETVRQTAKVEIVEQPITGGMRADVRVDYGDPVAYRRLGESFDKIQQHRQDAERFASEAQLYDSQDGVRTYELSAEDVHYFRLSGRPRAE
jgi:hypothetical protein